MPFPVPPPAPPPIVDVLLEEPQLPITDHASAVSSAEREVPEVDSVSRPGGFRFSTDENCSSNAGTVCIKKHQGTIAASRLGEPVRVDVQTSFGQFQPERSQPEFAMTSVASSSVRSIAELDAIAQLPAEPEEETIPAVEPDGEVLTIPTEPEPPADSVDAPVPPTEAVETEAPADAPAVSGELEMPALPEFVELRADRQEYDSLRQVLLAEGNVEMRFQGSVLTADRLRVNLPNRTAVAEGDVILTRGEQVLEGEQFNYNFGRQEGVILNARGEVDFVASETDFLPPLPTDVSARASDRLLSDDIRAGQPVTTAQEQGALSIGVGSGAASGQTLGIEGEVNRLRYEAERIEFAGENWVATNVSLTNDPFSPPELEIRSPQLTFTRLNPTQSELRARNPRLVFDQGLSLPFPLSRVLIGPREENPGLVQFGFDERDRGGFFIERSFSIISSPTLNLRLSPQIYVQRAIDEDGFFDSSAYGVDASLNAILGPTTRLRGDMALSTLDTSDIEDNLRASLRLQQQIGDHGLNLEYIYRDRLFNGSLGFQNVQQSLGLVLVSPQYTLGNTGIQLSYQAGVQFINADTDQVDLLEPIRNNNRVDLTRYQVSAALSRGFLLWAGQPLPATPTEGLRYTSTPVVPYVTAFTGLRGLYSAYSSGDHEAALTGTIGLAGQFGHFSRPFLDYTGFNITYSLTGLDGESPFLFDRIEDQQVLTLGLVQQIYGPIRFGIRTSINLDKNEEIDTEFSLEYSRRTFSVVLRFNPERETGSLNLRVSDFNWTGDPAPFSGIGTDTIDGGIRRRN